MKSLVVNNSGLEPLGHAVLVRPYEPEIHKGIIAIPEDVQRRTSMLEQRATVIAVGVNAWTDEIRPRAAPGDRVLVSRHAGFQATGPADGKLYRIVNANDVFCKITSETDIAIEAQEARLNEIDLTGRAANG